MSELVERTILYGMLCAGIVAYIFYFYEMFRHYTAEKDKPVARPPFAPLIVLICAILLIFVANVDPVLPDPGQLARVGAVLVLAWLGWFLWRRT